MALWHCAIVAVHWPPLHWSIGHHKVRSSNSLEDKLIFVQTTTKCFEYIHYWRNVFVVVKSGNFEDQDRLYLIFYY